MAHGHGHHHHRHRHLDPNSGDFRVVAAILANLGLTVAQVVGGLLSGSLALIADALHNFSDAMSLVIAFGARRVARRRTDASMTFGYGRAEVVAALVNLSVLIVLGLFLLYEAGARALAPQPVEGWTVVWVAAVALAVDVATALLTYRMSKTSVNIRAAFLHNVADALGSIAVIVAGVAILLYDWRLIDPLVTAAIAVYILWMSYGELGGVIRILMLGSPPDLDAHAVVDAARSVAGVADVHHVHLWQVGEHENAFDAHLALDDGAWPQADRIKAEVKALLKQSFGIAHATLEVECAAHACVGAPVLGR
ncbi:MAG: cation diffusion facilitator family transporter [Alphaproteobacteria bacterium]